MMHYKLQRIRDIVHGAVTFAEVLQALIDLDNIINEPFKPEEVKKKCSN
jgi:hypothetical protein